MKTTKSYKRIIEAQSATEIVEAIAETLDGPAPSVEELRKWTTQEEGIHIEAFRTTQSETEYPEPPPADTEPEAWAEKAWYRFDRCFLIHAKYLPSNLYEVLENRPPLKSEDMAKEPIEQKQMGAKTYYVQKVTIKNKEPEPKIENHEAAARRNRAMIEMYVSLSGGIRERNLPELHQFYVECFEYDRTLKHFLAPIIQAWQKDQNAKHVSEGHDHLHPVAVIKSQFINVREISLSHCGSYQMAEIKGIFQPPEKKKQLDLPFISHESKIPPVLPLEIANNFGLPQTTKAGAVSMPLRLFFEALMALEPSETETDLIIRLGDLLSYLNPNGYHRTNHLPYVVAGLQSLQWAIIPYTEKVGGKGLWIPVRPKNLPTIDSKDDFPIRIDVSLPPDATTGPMVEKSILRLLGKNSAAKFNAYLVACGLFDRYGTRNGTLMDPTKPAEKRNAEGHLLDANGKAIFNSRGNPIKNPYHPEAVKRLKREDNPATIKNYPILSFDDLVRACFPKGVPNGEFAKYLTRALGHWRALEMEEIIRIEEHSSGLRILPSARHIAVYRGLKEATKKSG